MIKHAEKQTGENTGLGVACPCRYPHRQVVSKILADFRTSTILYTSVNNKIKFTLAMDFTIFEWSLITNRQMILKSAVKSFSLCVLSK